MENILPSPPFALLGGTGTYHVSVYQDGSPYPQRRLWWFPSSTSFEAYRSLENAYRAVYAHEFFHMVQWNAVLSAGCSMDMWDNVFIEGQGKFAPSVQYPEMEIVKNRSNGVFSEYRGAANRFLTQRLNSSYRDLEADMMDRYDATLYWRFLYERFNGMGVVRAAAIAQLGVKT